MGISLASKQLKYKVKQMKICTLEMGGAKKEGKQHSGL